MKRCPKPMILRSIIVLTMASSILIPFFLLLLLRASTAAADLQEACNATHFPLQCHSSLSPRLPPNPTPLQIIHSAISLSSDQLTLVRSNLRSILNASSSSSSTTTTVLGSVLANNATRSTAFKTCLQVLYYSHHRTSLAARAIPTKHARAWLSAALAYQYGCWSGLTYVNANDTAGVPHAMSLLDTLVNLTSNALSMLVSYHRFGNSTAAWTPPLTERHAFWEPPVAQGLASLPSVPDTLAADATVCKEKGGGCFERVQDAVNAAPDNGRGRFVIHIKEGVYTERIRIPLRKRNVVFLGDGMGKTVITGSANVGQPGVTTYNSATLGVAGDGFIAKDLTIENTAGPNAHQAVAFRSDSDLSVIENCEFIGNQDTLYAHSLRQFYKSCRIQGNVDFIFGNSASIFQDCEILVRPRQERPEKGENNAITAHGRTDPAQSTGFVFHNCTINGTEEYMTLYNSMPQVHRNYLGRPWKEYSRTIFIHSFLGALISPEGWMPWNGDFALKTLYYGEFENSGPGSNLTQRVPWSNQVPAEHVLSYSVQSFIEGDDWNHGLPY